MNNIFNNQNTLKQPSINRYLPTTKLNQLTQDPANPPAINAKPKNKNKRAFQTNPEPAYENASPCKRLLSIRLILTKKEKRSSYQCRCIPRFSV
jgi:hypothetical protein